MRTFGKKKQSMLNSKRQSRKTYRYMELNQYPTRKEQIQIAIRNIDPMADQMGIDIQNRKRDAFHKLWSQLEDFTHHRSISATDEEKFRGYVATLEQLVYDLLAPITAQDQDEIQTILNRPEHPEADAATLYKLISRRGANYVYFFTHAADSYWIPHLKNKGFFRDPPKAEYSSDGYVNLPFWPEIQYLNRVCESAPEEVLQLVQELPAVDNPRVYENILDIALKFEGTRSAKLKPKMIEYAKLENQFLPFQFPKLLAHWTSERQTEAALELANILVQFVPDPRAEEKQKQERTLNVDGMSSEEDEFTSMMTLLRPLPRFNENYQEILYEGVRPLAEKEPYRVARILIDATSTMIRLGMHQDDFESGKSSDYSESWCPRLNKPKHEHPDRDESLVHTLTDVCERVYEQKSKSIESLDNDLRNQRWDVFRRVRQHLYAKYPSERTRPWIQELILSHRDYGRWEHHYEFQRMIRLACEHFREELLTEDDRSQIFDAILCGPPEEDFREWLGDKFTEIDFEQRRRYFHRQQLRPFASVLFGKYLDDFKRLEAVKTEEEITDASYAPDRDSKGGLTKLRSPRSTEDLASLSDNNLLAFINDWEDEHWDTGDGVTEINIEALAGAFQMVFKDSVIPNAARLNFWIDNRDNILRPIYVRTIVDVMKDSVEAKHFDKLGEWFSFCEWVLLHSESENDEAVRIGRLGDGSREHPNWYTSRRAVCDFIETCIKQDVNVPYSFRGQLGDILNLLCTQFDSNLDKNKRTLLDRDSPYTEAINAIRGRALENLVDFGYWLRRYDEKADVCEIKALLEKRSGPDAEFSLTIPEYAILGRLYTWILGLDEKWAVDRKSAFFPRKNMRAWREAFGNLLRWSHANTMMFKKIQDDFEFALEHMDSCRRKQSGQQSVIDLLGQHLFSYFLWGKYPLNGDDSLLERFYEKTGHDPTHWANLFAHVGRTLQNSGRELDHDLRGRIVAFFDWRLVVGEPSELQQFVFWLEAECMEGEWRLKAYSRILELFQNVDWDQWKDQTARLPSQAMHSIGKMIPAYTAGAIECLAKLIESMPTSGVYYIPTDDAKAILTAGRDHDDQTVRKKADETRENMLKRGFLSVKDR